MNVFKMGTLAAITALSFVSVAAAADGTINFTGEITDVNCEIGVNGSGSDTGNVNMGKVAKSAFKGVGSTAGGNASATGFTIELKNCPDVVRSSAVTFKFDGKNVNGDDNILALTEGEGVAKGVGIQLYDKDNAIIKLAQPSTEVKVTEAGSGTTNTVPFYARYIQTADVSIGQANAVATFTVNY